jgi:hypothetical protein
MPDESSPSIGGAAPPTRPCPVCGRIASAGAVRPFCSARCRQVDLGRWLSGQYVIPAGSEGQDQD